MASDLNKRRYSYWSAIIISMLIVVIILGALAFFFVRNNNKPKNGAVETEQERKNRIALNIGLIIAGIFTIGIAVVVPMIRNGNRSSGQGIGTGWQPQGSEYTRSALVDNPQYQARPQQQYYQPQPYYQSQPFFQQPYFAAQMPLEYRSALFQYQSPLSGPYTPHNHIDFPL
jgi:flagellar basal body-associated protein FliL